VLGRPSVAPAASAVEPPKGSDPLLRSGNMSDSPPRRAPRTVGAAALVLAGVLLLVAGAYVPRELFDDAELVAAGNLVLRGLGFAALAGAAALLVTGRGSGGPSTT